MWGEATRNPPLVALAQEILGELRTVIAGMLERWQSAGNTLPIRAEDLTPVLLSLVQGFVVQQALIGGPPADNYGAAVAALFSASGPGPAGPGPAGLGPAASA